MPRQFFKLCFALQNQLTHTQLFLLKTMKTQKKITLEKTGSRERGGKGEREPDGGFTATTEATMRKKN